MALYSHSGTTIRVSSVVSVGEQEGSYKRVGLEIQHEEDWFGAMKDENGVWKLADGSQRTALHLI